MNVRGSCGRKVYVGIVKVLENRYAALVIPRFKRVRPAHCHPGLNVFDPHIVIPRLDRGISMIHS
jgi:hypothetical protein